MEQDESNWSERVEDLVEEGNIDEALSLLESLVSKLQTQDLPQSQFQLFSALFELATLYSTKGFSLKADEARSRAILIKDNFNQPLSPKGELIARKSKESSVFGNEASASIGTSDGGFTVESSKLSDEAVARDGGSDDDWEAIADCAPDELFPPKCLSEVSKLSLEDKKVQTPKQRGRGIFSNRKPGLYSDQQCDGTMIGDLDMDGGSHTSEQDLENRKLKYGTHHVLVLADFPPSTKTTDLEKLLENFNDNGVSIRWVNDTVALAVFRTPSIALEACNSIQCPFTVRILDADDVFFSSIQQRDLEPPRRRPRTSARTAQRLIAHGMGLKLPSTIGSTELRKQEEARRNRIVNRRQLRDDAWGDDVN